jgi:hypothetical protein
MLFREAGDAITRPSYWFPRVGDASVPGSPAKNSSTKLVKYDSQINIPFKIQHEPLTRK